MSGLIEGIKDRKWTVLNFIRRCRLVLKHRPLLTCPFCKGSGGGGDYYGEWCECHCCWQHWKDLTNWRMNWFEGRVPVWTWVQSKVAIRLGHWEWVPIHEIIRCKLGFHRWFDEDDTEPGLQICGTCYESRNVNKPGWKPSAPVDE